eukprot:UN28039
MICECPLFFAKQSVKHCKAVKATIDDTVIEAGGQYYRLQKALLEYCMKHKAPRNPPDFKLFLDDWLKNGQVLMDDELEICDFDLCIFGQPNFYYSKAHNVQ